MEREGGVKASGRVVPGLRKRPAARESWSLCPHGSPGASAPGAAALLALEEALPWTGAPRGVEVGTKREGGSLHPPGC